MAELASRTAALQWHFLADVQAGRSTTGILLSLVWRGKTKAEVAAGVQILQQQQWSMCKFK